MTLTFFSNMNMRLTLIFLVVGYAIFFGSTTMIEEGKIQMVGVGASVAFLILSLYYITREYHKEHAEVKRL